MTMTRFIGFAPDIPKDTPGVIIDCTQLISNEHAMAAAPATAAPTGLVAVTAAVRGAATVTSTTGTRYTYAGTQTDLYQENGTTWTDVGASSLSGSSENRWSFAQFGNATLASNNTQKIQAATGGNFTEIATAPVAEFIVGAKDFVLAFNTNEGTFGDQPDRWWSSSFQDHSLWTPDAAVQCVSGRLIGAGGALTAAAMLGQTCIAYKLRQMFQGQYVGPPVVWQWDSIIGEQGCVGPEAVTDIGGAHVFVGEDNIWIYDGTRAVPIAGDIRQWFYTELSSTWQGRTIVAWERKNNRIWIFYPNASSTGNPNAAVVYHLKTKRWGRANRTIEAALANYKSAGVTWDTLSGVSATWDGLPDIPWDSSFWQAGSLSFSIFDTSHKLQSLIGSGEDCTLTTGDVGDDIGVSSVNQVVLRFDTAPVSGTISGQIRDELGGSQSTGGSGTYSNEKFDIRQTARWHRFAISMTGDVEVAGMDVRAVKAGKR
jgi:hypothetical protein